MTEKPQWREKKDAGIFLFVHSGAVGAWKARAVWHRLDTPPQFLHNCALDSVFVDAC
jgi:hypothetical protein